MLFQIKHATPDIQTFIHTMNTTAAPDNIMRCNENEAALSLCIMSHNKALSSPPPSASSRPPAVLVSPVPPSPPAAASPAPVPTALPSPPPVVQNKVRVRNCKAPTQNGTVAIEEMTRLMRWVTVASAVTSLIVIYMMLTNIIIATHVKLTESTAPSNPSAHEPPPKPP